MTEEVGTDELVPVVELSELEEQVRSFARGSRGESVQGGVESAATSSDTAKTQQRLRVCHWLILD